MDTRQWNKTKSRDKLTDVWTADFDKGAKTSASVEERGSFQKMFLKQLHIQNQRRKNKNLNPYPTLYMKINSKWTINAKPKHKAPRKKPFVTLG